MKDATLELEAEPGSPEPEEESGKMSFLEHLDELRKRIIRIITYFGLGTAACFYFSKDIYEFIAIPIRSALPPGQNLVILNPTDGFVLYIKVALLTGIALTIPFTLYEVWKFIAPGLYRKEKKYVVPFLISSIFLFLLGTSFCYYIVLTPAYTFLLKIAEDFTPMIPVKEYMDLTLAMLLGFGLVFEMPVIIAFLALFGLVSPRFLWTKFKYAVIIMVAVAAIISPTGDAFNLLLWTAPMIVLYIISIGIAALFAARRKKRERS